MPAGTRRGLAVAMAMVTEGLTSPAASPGSRSMPNPGCRSWVPRVCPDATETHSKLSPTTLIPRSPAPPLPWAPCGAGTPQPTPPSRPAHRPQPGPPTGPGAAPPRTGGEELPQGRWWLLAGSHVAPRWVLRFPASQREPAVSAHPTVQAALAAPLLSFAQRQ